MSFAVALGSTVPWTLVSSAALSSAVLSFVTGETGPSPCPESVFSVSVVVPPNSAALSNAAVAAAVPYFVSSKESALWMSDENTCGDHKDHLPFNFGFDRTADGTQIQPFSRMFLKVDGNGLWPVSGNQVQRIVKA